MADFQEVTIQQAPTPAEAPKADQAPPPSDDPKLPSEQNQEGVEEATEETPPEGEEGQPDDAAEEAAEKAGIDIQAVETHFLEHGEIPADTYEKAAAIGISKEMVDEFVNYRVTQADRVRTEMVEPYGGEEAVTSMVEWAGKNWTEAQAAAFNEAVNSGDKGRIDLALRALKADFDKKNGVKPNLLKPSTSKAQANGVYTSMAQLLADQADPRYRTDPAYRDAVVKKLGRSGNLR